MRFLAEQELGLKLLLKSSHGHVQRTSEEVAEMGSMERCERTFKLGFEGWIGVHQAEIIKSSRAGVLCPAHLYLVHSCAQ